MKKQGQEWNWGSAGDIFTGECMSCRREDAPILSKSYGRRDAQRDPLRSLARTAIEVPGFEMHSHQLGIESLNRRPNYQL
jgi:hypothetical protein